MEDRSDRLVLIMDPETTFGDGRHMQMLTAMMHRVCMRDVKKFEEAERLLTLTYEAEFQHGQKERGPVIMQVPDYDEIPSEKWIEWINTCPIEWDGDPGGITLHREDGAVTAEPGEYVVQDGDDWFVLTRKRPEGQE